MCYFKNLIAPLLGVVLLLSGCEKEVLNSKASSLNRPVVEAYFHPGHIPAVKITQQIPLDGDSTESRAIAGLLVTVITPEDSFALIDQGNGIYDGDGTWLIEEGKIYQLSFVLNNETITSSTLIPTMPVGYKASASTLDVPTVDIGSGGPPTFPDPIKLTWENTDGSWYLVVVENIETDPTSIFNGERERPSFRSEPEQSNQYELGFQTFSFYGMHRVILFKINAEYASLYDDNGTSSQNLTTPFTNITGGLGIFTGINSDTLYVEVE